MVSVVAFEVTGRRYVVQSLDVPAPEPGDIVACLRESGDYFPVGKWSQNWTRTPSVWSLWTRDSHEGLVSTSKATATETARRYGSSHRRVYTVEANPVARAYTAGRIFKRAAVQNAEIRPRRLLDDASLGQRRSATVTEGRYTPSIVLMKAWVSWNSSVPMRSCMKEQPASRPLGEVMEAVAGDRPLVAANRAPQIRAPDGELDRSQERHDVSSAMTMASPSACTSVSQGGSATPSATQKPTMPSFPSSMASMDSPASVMVSRETTPESGKCTQTSMIAWGSDSTCSSSSRRTRAAVPPARTPHQATRRAGGWGDVP